MKSKNNSLRCQIVDSLKGQNGSFSEIVKMTPQRVDCRKSQNDSLRGRPGVKKQLLSKGLKRLFSFYSCTHDKSVWKLSIASNIQKITTARSLILFYFSSIFYFQRCTINRQELRIKTVMPVFFETKDTVWIDSAKFRHSHCTKYGNKRNEGI